MSVELYRIDDRLIHGQVVVGWGKPLGAEFIALVDDEVAASDWEQDLYRMGVPPEMDVYFDSIESAVARLPGYVADQRKGILLTGDVESMRDLAQRSGSIERVNIGGIHHRPGRHERLRYVFLTAEEEAQLRDIVRAGVEVSAQDVPTAAPVALEDVLASRGSA